MAASTRAAIKMKSKGKLASKKFNKGKAEVKKTKRKPLYKSKLKSYKRKPVSVDYDSSDGEVNADVQPMETEDVDVSDDGQIKMGNEGWADVMTRILNSSKDKKSVILSKAQTDREVALKKAIEKKEDFEVDPADKDGDKKLEEGVVEKKPAAFKDIKKQFVARREEKRSWESMGRVKPDITARQKERALQRIATRGVVHLFNAVKQRQKSIEVKVKEVGGSEVKKEKILKSMTKGEFLDALKNKAKSIPLEEASGSSQRKSKSEETKSESKPGWSIFCDDFMMGAKMKDWDKESDAESGAEVKQDLDEDVDVSSSDED